MKKETEKMISFLKFTSDDPNCYKGKCPFCGDSLGGPKSFHLWPTLNHWKCYKCHRSGSSQDFWDNFTEDMRKENNV